MTAVGCAAAGSIRGSSMSKVLAATCSAAGVVTADGVVVPEAEVLSEGAQASSGVLILDKGLKTYVASSASDVKSTLEKVSTALDDISTVLTTIATALTSIGAGMTGPTTAPPPTLPTDVSEIASKASAIAALKIEVDTLKGALK